MAFRFHKSIKVGPLRLNLSKSGVGVSAGIKGLRIGTGPRGNYIRVGKGGAQYLSSKQPNIKDMGSEKRISNHPVHQPMQGVEMEEIESENVLEMQDSTSKELLEELNSKQEKISTWPFIAAMTVGAIWALYNFKSTEQILLITAVTSIVVIFLAVLWDKKRKVSALLYDLDQDTEAKYRRLHEAFDKLDGAIKKWHIEAKGDVLDSKYHAGANQLVKRKRISLSTDAPRNIKTNISVPSIPVGKQTLYFFPDRLLVFGKNVVGAVLYKELELSVQSGRFIEEEAVPKDAKVVDYTWKYVNKNGGPDRRFNDNQEIPVVLYDDIWFRSKSGLKEYIQISHVGAATKFVAAVHNLVG